MKLLLIEDEQVDLDACKTTLNRWNNEHEDASIMELVEKHSLSDALVFLRCYESTQIEGIILDLRLNQDDGAGEKIIKVISDMKRRIPIFVFTATPDALSFPYVLGKRKKGECTYEDVFNQFDKVRKIGLSKILGNEGKLEDTLKRIFDYGIIQYVQFWSEYAENVGSEESECALARHVSLQLHDAMDGDCEKFAPNEFYVTNLDEKREFVRSGELLKAKKDGMYYVVLTPPCDLVLHTSKKVPNSKTVLLGTLNEAEKKIKVILEINRKRLKKEGFIDVKIDEELSNLRQAIESNKHCLYCHYFPMAMGQPGMLLNFRELKTKTHDEIANEYERTGLRVAPTFFRDVLARFSSYYGRQGQPELNLSFRIMGGKDNLN